MRMELNTNNPLRQASVNGLAIVGFLALVFAGMTLAIYAARFVPTAVSQVASASVYLSSFFNGTTNNQLEVVSDGTTKTNPSGTTLPIAPSTTTSTIETPAATTPAGGTAVTPTAGTKTNSAYVISGSQNTQYTGALTGLSDLTVKIIGVGYLETSGVTESFVASTNVPTGKQGAVRFSVTNIGTNLSGSWNFDASLPTVPDYTFSSPNQLSLNPGEHIEFTLGYDKGRTGTNREASITVDPNKTIVESNENNNNASATIEIK